MDNKQFQFTGKAGGYFVVAIVVTVGMYIPIVGWPFALNYGANWLVDSTLINGKKIKYSAGYGESLVFLLINILLVIITVGIYTFWFVPKLYRYIADHTVFDDGTSPAPKVEAKTAEAPASSTPTTPATSTDDAPSTPTESAPEPTPTEPSSGGSSENTPPPTTPPTPPIGSI